MNVIEIEQAVADLAAAPFDAAEFPFAFLAAFDNPAATIKRLREGETNKSGVPGAVLQRKNIHIATCAPGAVTDTLRALRDDPATAKHKARFLVATDGEDVEAEDLSSGDTLACKRADLPDHFGFFLALAGIKVTREIAENAFDIRATGRLNKLYLELSRSDPEWAADQHAMNHFMARLIFCFFAEDTGIFTGRQLFTDTVQRMGERDGSNTDEVLATLFRAMNTKHADRVTAGLPRWALPFPYVNGGLFAGDVTVPRFSKAARTYLIHIGDLDWTKINPDIFGSMVQAVANEAERGSLGMHYTSVPNILKVLNPLFLDDLRAQLEAAGDNSRKLLNLRKRLSRIRVFDPACGSGNFLVVAYREMRAIEHEIDMRREGAGQKSGIPLTNLRGIEIVDFAAEIARLALVIAEFQANARYLGQREALNVFLPLSSDNWVTCANALRLDWRSVCPPTGTGVKLLGDDLFNTPLEQAEIDFENAGGETYLCGNPPYLGALRLSSAQKADMGVVCTGIRGWGILDLVAAWFILGARYCAATGASAAFVATNSICQGQQVATLWPEVFRAGCAIRFAHTSFKWSNLAAHNAGVTVVVVGIDPNHPSVHRLFETDADGTVTERACSEINAYLTPGRSIVVGKSQRPLCGQTEMIFGSMPNDGGHLLLDRAEVDALGLTKRQRERYVRRFWGAQELIDNKERYCLWIEGKDYDKAIAIPSIEQRINAVKAARLASKRPTTNALAGVPYRFGEVRQSGVETVIVVPAVSSENRPYLPVGLLGPGNIVSNRCFTICDAPLWNLALIASRMHLVWVATVCGRLEMRFNYSNTLGWNTFPLPDLTEQNKADLTRCAEKILLAREAHFPATIADLYVEGEMPDDLKAAHAENDEALERIYIGRRFKNDTERLEVLLDRYEKLVTGVRTTRGRT